MNEIKQLMLDTAFKSASWQKFPVLIAALQTGIIERVHPFAAATFGYTVEELVGQPVEILVPAHLRQSHALWRQDVSTPTMRPMGLGRQVYGMRKDGSVFPAIVLLTSEEVEGVHYGVALVVDISNIPAVAAALSASAAPAWVEPIDEPPAPPPTEETP